MPGIFGHLRDRKEGDGKKLIAAATELTSQKNKNYDFYLVTKREEKLVLETACVPQQISQFLCPEWTYVSKKEGII